MPKFDQKTPAIKGQSFVELALILPILMFLLAGLVEIGALIYDYLSILDVAREAARFASEHDHKILVAPPGGLPQSACADDALHFYYDTACVVVGTGFNTNIKLDPARDDVAISVFTIDDNQVKSRNPYISDDVWSLYSDNWTKDCEGNVVSTTPFMTNAEMNARLVIATPTVGASTPTGSASGGAPTDKGRVLVEVYYCHEQILNLPIASQMLPNPVRLHAYTIMPAPEAAPTPTPMP